MTRYGGFHTTEYLRYLEESAICMSLPDAQRYLFVKTDFSWLTCQMWACWLFECELIKHTSYATIRE
jgi:hypothetical protein